MDEHGDDKQCQLQGRGSFINELPLDVLEPVDLVDDMAALDEELTDSLGVRAETTPVTPLPCRYLSAWVPKLAARPPRPANRGAMSFPGEAVAGGLAVAKLLTTGVSQQERVEAQPSRNAEASVTACRKPFK